MSFKTPVKTNDAPRNDLLLSQAIIFGGVVYCSGSVGLDPKTNELVSGGIGERTAQAIRNLTAVLEAAGSNINNVVKVTIFITDMQNYAAVNKVYEKYWGDIKPARTCVAVHQLPLLTDVEIECIAHM